MNTKSLLIQAENLEKLFSIYFFLALTGIISGLWEYFLIQKILSWEGDFSSNISVLTIFQTVISILRGLTSLFLAFYFIKWLFHSMRSLEKNKEVYYLNNSSSSAIWSWFIPVLNLFQPYQIVRENFETWKNLAFGKKNISSVIVSWWWFFFIFTIAADFFGIGILEGIQSSNLEKYSGNPWPFFIPGLIEVVAILLSRSMMKKFAIFYEAIVGE
ncbi:MAG: DUF4328 domain-containing protein [Bacteroidales bacterium]